MTQDRNLFESGRQQAVASQGEGLKGTEHAQYVPDCDKSSSRSHLQEERERGCCISDWSTWASAVFPTHIQNVEVWLVRHFRGQLSESFRFKLIASAWDHQNPAGLTAACSGCFGKGGPWNGKMTLWNQDSPYCTNERLQARLVRSVWQIRTDRLFLSLVDLMSNLKPSSWRCFVCAFLFFCFLLYGWNTLSEY